MASRYSKDLAASKPSRGIVADMGADPFANPQRYTSASEMGVPRAPEPYTEPTAEQVAQGIRLATEPSSEPTEEQVAEGLALAGVEPRADQVADGLRMAQDPTLDFSDSPGFAGMVPDVVAASPEPEPTSGSLSVTRRERGGTPSPIDLYGAADELGEKRAITATRLSHMDRELRGERSDAEVKFDRSEEEKDRLRKQRDGFMAEAADIKTRYAGKVMDAFDQFKESRVRMKEEMNDAALLAKHHRAADVEQIKEWQDIAENGQPEQAAEARRMLAESQEIRGMSGGEAIAAALAQAMGTYAAIMTNTPNFAMQIIEKGIQRRIQLQKDNYALRRQGVADARDKYGRLREAFMDDKAAEDALYAAELSGVQGQLDRLTALTDDETQKQSAAQFKLALEEKRIQANMAAEQRGLVAAEKHFGDLVKVAGLEGQERARELQARIAWANLNRKGTPEQMSEGSAIKMAELKKGFSNLRKMRNDFKGLDWKAVVEQYVPGTNARNFKKTRGRVIQELVKALQGSRPSDRDQAIFDALIPSSWSHSSTAEAMFQGWEDHFNSQYTTMREALGKIRKDVSQFPPSLAADTEGFMSEASSATEVKE